MTSETPVSAQDCPEGGKVPQNQTQGPRRAIVRVLPHPSDEGSFYVHDWEASDGYARFSLPHDHPLAIHLKPHLRETVLVVASTEEIEWVVHSMSWTLSDCEVRLRARNAWVKDRLITDEYLEFLGAVS